MDGSIALVDYHPHHALEYLINVTHSTGTPDGLPGQSKSAKVRVFHASFATHGILREWLATYEGQYTVPFVPIHDFLHATKLLKSIYRTPHS